jgi:threonine dehydrogenase-like Zn-dependent dehydrogenase
MKPGQFVIGSFFASDNTCLICKDGYQSSCQHREFVGGAQASMLRVPLADGTLVATRNIPSEDLIPSLLTLSDVMGTGWFAANAANMKPGVNVAIVGDGAVGLLGVLAANQMRPGGFVSYVGVPHEVELNGGELFFAHVHLHGGPGPVRRFLPELLDLVWNKKINPGKLFVLTLPLDRVAEGYRAMDERRAIKTLLRP